MYEFWYRISDWFNDLSDRHKLIKEFNIASKNAYVFDGVPTLLEARITSGDTAYRHQFSKFLGGGFRIKVMSGRQLGKDEMIEIGQIILSNDTLVRQLISLGWDTLEIHSSTGSQGLKWELRKFAKIGGILC